MSTLSDKDRVWESYVEVEHPQEWILRDFPLGHIRYTHYPSQESLLKQPCYTLQEWCKKRDAFFGKFPPGIFILNERSKYIGTPADVIGFDGDMR